MFPKQQILDSSNLKEFAYNNFKFDENGTKFSKWVENTVSSGDKNGSSHTNNHQSKKLAALGITMSDLLLCSRFLNDSATR